MAKLSSTDIYGNLKVSGTIRGDDTGWIDMTLVNSWVFYGVPWSTPQYRRIGNIVYLKGLVGGGSSTTAIITTLPAGFRPNQGSIRVVQGALGPHRVTLSADGTVQPSTGASVTWVSLDDITFMVD